MDIFLEKFNPPQLHWEEIEIMNNSIRSKVIEAVVKNLKTNKQTNKKAHTEKQKQKNKIPGPDGFTEASYQTFREELMPILLNLFQKNCRGSRTSKLIL